jgi:hypothetical protein
MQDDNSDFALAEAERMQALQMANADGLHTKSGLMVGFAGVFIGLAADMVPPPPGTWNRCTFAAALAVATISVLCGIVSFFVTEYHVSPRPQTFDKLHGDGALVVMKAQLLGNLEEDYEDNRSTLIVQARWLKGSQALFLIAAVLLAATLLGGILS